VSAWKRKEGAKPKAPALSFSVKRKEQKDDEKRPAPDNAVPQGGGGFDDDLPF